MPTSLTTIERDQLEAVSAGTARAKQDERILDKLQSLANAVHDVAAQQQNQPNPAAAAMPLVALKAIRQRQL